MTSGHFLWAVVLYSTSPLLHTSRSTSRRRWLALFAGELAFGLDGHAAGPALRAAVYDVPLYGFRSSTGAVAGVMVDWFQELALAAKLDIDVELTPLARVVRSIVQGQVDMAVLIDAFPLPRNVQALGAVGTMQPSVRALNDSQLRIRGDLAGRRITVLRGGSAERFANSQPGVTVEPESSIGAMISMLRLRRVDALLVTEPALREYLTKAADEEFFVLTRRVFNLAAPLRLYVHDRVGQPTIAKLRGAVETMSAGQRYDALLARIAKAQPPLELTEALINCLVAEAPDSFKAWTRRRQFRTCAAYRTASAGRCRWPRRWPVDRPCAVAVCAIKSDPDSSNAQCVGGQGGETVSGQLHF